jgi:hypothetical protein
MTFGTAGKGRGRASFRPMQAIATITWIASATCVFAFIGILWREAERADEAVATNRGSSTGVHSKELRK